MKKSHEIDDYMRLGAQIRLAWNLLTDACCSPVLRRDKSDKLGRITDRLDAFRYEIDKQMGIDCEDVLHGQWTHVFLNLFSGERGSNPTNTDLDRRMIEEVDRVFAETTKCLRE